MKKSVIIDPAFKSFLNKIPARKLQSTTEFCGEKSAEEAELVYEVVKSTDMYKQKQDDLPRLNYVSHQKRDGLITSKMLADELVDNGDFPTVVYNPEINSDDATSYIKENSLKSLAVELGYADAKKTSVFKTVGSIVTGVFGSIGSVAAVFDLISNFDVNGAFKSLLGSKTIIIAVFSVFMLAVFFAFIVSAVMQKKRNSRELISQAVKNIRELSDDEFESFLENLSAEDFSISDCNVKGDSVPVIICALQNYKHRQKCILMRYLTELRGKQSWWIFAEGKKTNQAYIFDSSDKVSCRYYTMQPLSKNEKLQLAAEIYSSKIKIKPSEDSGIKSLGLDYICRFIIKKSDVQIDKAVLTESINEFVKEYTSYAIDIRLVIRLIAELGCNYEIDFTNKRNWEHLFTYNNSIAALENLDIQITKDLMLDNRAVKNLIPHIVDRFGEYFEEILTMNENNMLTTSQKQWCIVKLLKCKRNAGSLIALNDALMSEFSSVRADRELLDNMQTTEWAVITVKAMKRFYDAQDFWVLPLMINNMLYVFGREKKSDIANTLPDRIFSMPEFLEVAKAVVLLGISSGDGGASYENCDILRDHYLVVKNAVYEREPNFNFENNTGCPQFFGLLKFSNDERLMYYNALRYLQENDVIRYFELIFDLFCVSASTETDKKIRFCSKTIYSNTFYEKYLKKSATAISDSNDYIKVMLKDLLEMLHRLYGENFEELRSETSKLLAVLDGRAENPEEDIHILLMYADIFDTETITFSSCMVSRVCGILNISKEIYIGLNNYLLAMTFLVYHENRLGSYYNDDFVHLVKLLTAYTEPDEVVLGLIYYLHTMFKPKYSGQLIGQYIGNKDKNSAYIYNLKNVARSIQTDDLENFIAYLNSAGLETNVVNEVLLVVRERIMSVASTFPDAGVLLECISLFCDGKSTEEFLKDTPENNLTKISKLSANMVYIIFVKYTEIYESDYLELTHMVVSKLLYASSISAWLPILVYIFNSKNKTAPEYIRTERLFLAQAEKSQLSVAMLVLEWLKLFAVRLSQKKNEAPELYEWLNKERIYSFIEKVDEKTAQRYLVETREYLSIRTWRKYGIASYLRYLMRSSNDYRWENFSEYDELDGDEKFRYLLENFSELEPYVEVNGYKRFNSVYLDLLTAFIDNRNNIQNLIDERVSLKKFAEDARKMVDLLIPRNEKCKNEIMKLIFVYMSIADRGQ